MNVTFCNVAILSPGDMGHGVGEAIHSLGFEVTTCLDGRGEGSRKRAERAGMVDVSPLSEMVAGADIVLSILPPAAALDTVRAVAEAAGDAAGKHYADLNAISPDTSRAVGQVAEAAGFVYTDGGIIGGAPGRSAALTRIYVSGPDAEVMSQFQGAGMDIKYVGEEIGRASAVKMCYAGLTKGTNSLMTAVLTAAVSLGIWDELTAELASSQEAVLRRAEGAIPRLPADAGRWIGEMDEIAATFRSAGVTGGFHDGAGDIFALLAATPFSAETRETRDRERTMEATLKETVKHLPGPRG